VDSGFYAACAGLRAQSEALEIAAHNLANLNTAGFRSEETSFESLVAAAGPGFAGGAGDAQNNSLTTAFSRVVGNALNAATNNFGVLGSTHLDLTAGSLQPTGNHLDVGIEGSGFFVVKTARGTRYTRNGSFQVSNSGILVTTTGDPVLSGPGGGAPINVPAGAVSIAADGTISVNGAVAGTIRLAEFAPGTRLTPEIGSMLVAPADSAKAATQSTVRQGMLESSNVNSMSSVATLIGIQRQAEMLQRAMSLFDTEFDRIAASDLPKV
jgi:flagellar basal-body rod protein FlgF